MMTSSVLRPENIILDLVAETKEDLVNELAEKLNSNGHIHDLEQFKQDIWAREDQVPTEVGFGIAIPHAKSAGVKSPAIIMGRSLNGIKYSSEKCNLFFMIAACKDSSTEHLKTLSKISTFLMDETFRAKLILAKDSHEVVQLFANAEEKMVQVDANDKKYFGKKLVGVTGCPTGIAHTFMAAEALKNAAEELGVQIKVQTNGSTGIQNRLTQEDIDEADGIIVAADVKVDMDVFGDRKVIKTSVKNGIHHAKDLIEDAISGKGTVLNQGNNKLKEAKEKTRLKQPKIYSHIMNGVSFMIPFVVAGGILIAISFMFGIHASDPTSSEYNAFAAFLGTAGGSAAFALMVPVLAGYIAYSIADRPGLAPGMIGGMMATLGGSGFLGGMIAGFIAGYTILGLKKILKGIPDSLQSLSPVLILPLVATFVTAFIMHFVINSPMAWINESLQGWLNGLTGSNAILLGALLAGMMASDMGGPINKTASAFGLAMFANHIYEPSAALMVGGMVPPLGIALATTLFKNKFSLEERNAGKAAYIMGASFITEAAIPFAASDPLRIIPANIVGSAIGGGICMALGISLQAPHGGIFVIPIAANSPLLYIVCILIGSIITACIIGVLKKPVYRTQDNTSMKSGNKTVAIEIKAV
ncbi:fructose-specific PTS transporter subunit EIIC [Peribacillus frigoritolerans]|uniref:PTS fructose transporter subunit IIABC n=1 Tax=Peribacillus frigoritolerans TaxID=450367 RepID=UPI002B25308D|nr:fructose-specific PTS transporter subunit EIIC [Peribacillus frigoritolerans]MEB2492976.1 fructose-specific PTS transporter subunit EIIC [Peribacillus frigoritolerans]